MPTSAARLAEASARSAAMSASPASSATAARARSAIERATRSVQGCGADLRATSRAFSLLAAAEREPAAGQQLKRSGPPYAWDEHELVAARGLDEGVDGTSGVTGLEERGGDRHPGRADETLIQPLRQLDVLLRGAERHVDVTRGERGERALDQVPREGLDVARQSRALRRRCRASHLLLPAVRAAT